VLKKKSRATRWVARLFRNNGVSSDPRRIPPELFARSFSSVLPPPSRFACASASALFGRAALFEFTRTTSITLWGSSRPPGLIILKPSPRTRNEWNAIDPISATCMVATSPKRSSKKSEKETRASGEGCLNCIGRNYEERAGLAMTWNCTVISPRSG
jgi:hypothetical protein